ncbi:FAD-binding protein [Methylopila sp. M107]|uniref:FAD-binding protein n=1 Tax=Methylopila sp. M107 TaxID=1101190 RepID=UPI0003A93307|nr:FAD-binding protein [Methylopila sp. M107]
MIPSRLRVERALFSPDDERQLVEILVERSANKLPVRVEGGGTRIASIDTRSDASLSTRQLTGVVSYEPGELTLIARAGAPLAEIRALTEAAGQSLAFEPMDSGPALGTTGVSTIGSVVASNMSGPRRIQTGACRDHLLGVKFIDGAGRSLQSGGRVMKNVTGLDLTKLLCGSHGVLGVLTEVAFKTLPLSEQEATIVFAGLDVHGAVGLFSKALGTPFEISGAAYFAGVALLRVEGLAAQVAHRCRRLQELFSAQQPDILDGAGSRALWRRFRDVEHFGDTSEPLWRIIVKPTDAPRVTDALEARGGATSLDWGGGLIWYAGSVAGKIIRAIASPGHATLVRRGSLASDEFVFTPEKPVIASIASDLRRTFDPAGILNPGLMGD